MPIPNYVTLLRLVIPLFIFKWPLWGTLAAGIMDVQDWSLIHITNASDYVFYQNWDKAMDLYYLTFALITTYRWKDKIAQKVAWILFAWRLIGLVIFWHTENPTFLFIFPNVFESFFIFYLLFVFIFKRTKLFISWKIAAILVIVLGIPKLANEYFLHVLQKQIWEVWNFGKILGYSGWHESLINFYMQGLILYIMPFAIGFLLIYSLLRTRGSSR
jgi:hypothetical protein